MQNQIDAQVVLDTSSKIRAVLKILWKVLYFAFYDLQNFNCIANLLESYAFIKMASPFEVVRFLQNKTTDLIYIKI